MPSFSSTRSFMRWTCRVHSAISHPETCVVRFISCFRFVRAYLVVGLDVQLDLFAGEGADSGWGEDWSAFLRCCFWGNEV